jgi:hypothetical protein
METVWIRDPGWKKVGSGIRDKHPGSATLGLTVLCIRIRMDPHHFGNLDPHQIKIRIRIKVISWIRNRIRIRINLQLAA